MFHPSLNTHFNAPVDRAALEAVRAFGFRWARADVTACDSVTVHQILADLQACGLRPLPIVYDIEHLLMIPAGMDAEWGNEPDGDIWPSWYRAGLDEACACAVDIGVSLWAPAISNLDRNSLRWMACVRADQWPAGLAGITVHRYGDGSFDYAHDGFASRDEEVAALLALCDGLPYMVTEFGYPNDPGGLTEEQSAANIAKEWEFWRRHGCQVPFLYQINDGPNPGEAYGIRRCGADGHPLAWDDPHAWKPAAYQVPQAQEQTTMHIGIGVEPFPASAMRVAKSLNALGDGTYTVSNLDDTVMSVNPQGSVETRPAGTNGAWERCTRLGNVVYYNPIGEAVYAFAFAEGVPS
jgi:hypothetical protein